MNYNMYVPVNEHIRQDADMNSDRLINSWDIDPVAESNNEEPIPLFDTRLSDKYYTLEDVESHKVTDEELTEHYTEICRMVAFRLNAYLKKDLFTHEHPSNSDSFSVAACIIIPNSNGLRRICYVYAMDSKALAEIKSDILAGLIDHYCKDVFDPSLKLKAGPARKIRCYHSFHPIFANGVEVDAKCIHCGLRPGEIWKDEL